tara:strand:+ start:96 stop:1136 length:1041 start_codon:yes stop_codon:yes gene_type:complete
MKIYKSILIILVIFIKTGNVLSSENIFNVNNIEIEIDPSASFKDLSNKAVQKGFEELINKILLKDDIKKLTNIKLQDVKDLVLYYQTFDEKKINLNKKIFNIYFDRDKIHSLFYKKGIAYSEVVKTELYLLPIIKDKDQLYIYNKNFFYEKWNEIFSDDLIEFVLPIENIETIQNLTFHKDNLFKIDLKKIFKEYIDESLALVVVEGPDSKNEKVLLLTNISGKKIDKTLVVKRLKLKKEDYFVKIINETSKELINLIKTQNLVDIRTPSFINAKLMINKKNNLSELNQRLKKIGLINDIYILELNKNYVLLKIKYLGKLDKIINKLEEQKIILKTSGEEWSIKVI